jgi:hypothetical protein
MEKLVRKLPEDSSELTPIPQTLSSAKFFNGNFRGADFKRRDLRRSTFMFCTFDEADMTDADCSGAEFYGSSFRETNCHGTNFKDAKMMATLFEPSDFYGMTMTFVCQTFQHMKVSRQVWDGFMFFGMGMMIPPKDSDGFDPRDAMIAAMGREYFVEYFEKFKARTL